MRTRWRSGDREWTVEVSRDGANRFRVRVDGAELLVEAEALADGGLRLRTLGGDAVAIVTPQAARRYVHLAGDDWLLERAEAAGRATGAAPAEALAAPMPGLVVKVHVQAGERVEKGAALVTVEAMKMEHVVRAPHSGRIVRLNCAPGQMVEPGMELVELGQG